MAWMSDPAIFVRILLSGPSTYDSRFVVQQYLSRLFLEVFLGENLGGDGSVGQFFVFFFSYFLRSNVEFSVLPYVRRHRISELSATTFLKNLLLFCSVPEMFGSEMQCFRKSRTLVLCVGSSLCCPAVLMLFCSHRRYISKNHRIFKGSAFSQFPVFQREQRSISPIGGGARMSS
jgi:hypothetical protein